VTTRLGTMPEIVEDGVTGLLVPPASPDALGEAMRCLVEDPARAEAMGRAGRTMVETLYTPQAHLEAMLDVYAQAAGRRGAAA